MNEIDYILVQGWAVKKLKLSGNDLLIFSLIYGFSKDGESYFYGSLKYIENWISASRSTVIRSLEKLTDAGYIIKESETRNHITFNKYKYNQKRVLEVINSDEMGGVKMIPGGYQNEMGGGIKMKPNNTISNNNSNNGGVSKKTDSHTSDENEGIDMFGNPLKGKMVMFKNSLIADFHIFEKQFQTEEFREVDLNHYFQEIRDWSLKKGRKELSDSEGWVARARIWMRRDFKDGKLVKKNRHIQKEKESEDYLEYLKQSHGDS